MKGVVALVTTVALSGLTLTAALAQQSQHPSSQSPYPSAQQYPSSQQSPSSQQTPMGQQPPSSQPQMPSSGASSAGGNQSGLAVASDSLLGTKVRNQQGQDIGEVSKLMIDPQQGTITSVVIRQGGTLGMGGKDVSVPWNALKLQRGQNQQLVVTMQQEMLEQAPAASPRTDDKGSGGQERDQPKR